MSDRGWITLGTTILVIVLWVSPIIASRDQHRHAVAEADAEVVDWQYQVTAPDGGSTWIVPDYRIDANGTLTATDYYLVGDETVHYSGLLILSPPYVLEIRDTTTPVTNSCMPQNNDDRPFEEVADERE